MSHFLIASNKCFIFLSFFILSEMDSNLVSAKDVKNKGINGMTDKAVVAGISQVVGSSSEAMWMQHGSSTEKFPVMDVGAQVTAHSNLDRFQLDRRVGGIKLERSLENKPVEDELENVIKYKLAEAKLYQQHADDAEREAESIMRIALAKKEKIDADYASRIARLCLAQAQEKRHQKLQEYQVLDRAQREYFSLKLRMEADIKDLMLKMEATKPNINP